MEEGKETRPNTILNSGKATAAGCLGWLWMIDGKICKLLTKDNKERMPVVGFIQFLNEFTKARDVWLTISHCKTKTRNFTYYTQQVSQSQVTG